MSLKDNIRNEFKSKIQEEKFVTILNTHKLNEDVFVSALEALLPDQDWKEKKDDRGRLILLNRNKLINKINPNIL